MLLQNFIVILTLIAGIRSLDRQPSQRLFKKMTFKASKWPTLVYKTVTADDRIECVSYCQIEVNDCSVALYNKPSAACYFGTIGANFAIVGTQDQPLQGYVDLGNF